MVPHAHQIWTNLTFRWAIVIFIVALVLRLIYLVEFSQTVLFSASIMDMKYHHQWAMAIAGGESFVDGSFFRAPFYPYLLGFFYSLFGSGDWAARILQMLMGSFSAVLVFLIGLRLFDRRTAIIAGLITAAFGTLIFYSGQLLIPTLVILLNLASILFLVRAVEKPTASDLFLAGLCLGASAIARPTILLFAGVVLIWLIYHRRRWHLKTLHVILYGLGLILPIIPVTAHNYAASGELTLIGTYGGLNAYIGNNAESDGVSAKLPGARRDWWGMMNDASRIAEQESGRSLTDAEQSGFWYRKTLSEIINDPIIFLGHLMRKAILLGQGMELSNNFDLYFFAHQSTLLKLLIWRQFLFLPWGLLVPLAIMGWMLIGEWTRPRQVLRLFIITYVVSVVLFFVTARYRLPLAPPLILLAAYAIARFPSIVKKQSKIRLLPIAATFVIALVVCNVDLFGYGKQNDGQAYYTLALMHGQRGEPDRQEYYYRRALDEDTTIAEAYSNLGLILSGRGKHDSAVGLLEQSASLTYGSYVMLYNLGYVSMKAGQIERARNLFNDVLREVPAHVSAANNLGLTYIRAGQLDSSLEVYGTLVQNVPLAPEGYYGLGMSYLLSGNNDSARVYLQRTIDVDPSFTRAYYGLGVTYTLLDEPDSATRTLRAFLDFNPRERDLVEHSTRLLDSLAALR